MAETKFALCWDGHILEEFINAGKISPAWCLKYVPKIKGAQTPPLNPGVFQFECHNHLWPNLQGRHMSGKLACMQKGAEQMNVSPYEVTFI